VQTSVQHGIAQVGVHQNYRSVGVSQYRGEIERNETFAFASDGTGDENYSFTVLCRRVPHPGREYYELSYDFGKCVMSYDQGRIASL
jgi:hypothetical protein